MHGSLEGRNRLRVGALAGTAGSDGGIPPGPAPSRYYFLPVALLREFHGVYFPRPTRDRAWPTRH